MTIVPHQITAFGQAAALDPAASGAILVVDDDRIVRMTVSHILEDRGHLCLEMSDGQSVIDFLSEASIQDISLMILDREMPGVSGQDVIAFCKGNARWQDLPIIMLTGADAVSDMQTAIDAGVYYYLTKPVEENLLVSVTQSALRSIEAQVLLDTELTRHKVSFSLMSRAHFAIQTLEEARALACFLANGFPFPNKVVTGLGALLENAVEHGLLGVGFDTKGTWLASGDYEQMLAQRQRDIVKDADTTKVDIIFVRDQDKTIVEIADPGPGFAWEDFIDLDPSRAELSYGRGIAQARLHSFDKLQYNTLGNRVQASCLAQPPVIWKTP